MQQFQIETKAVKQIADQIGYRCKTVVIQPATSFTLQDLNWSGGTKNEYHWMNLLGGDLMKPSLDKAPWENYYEGAVIEIPPNHIVVQSGTFMGKPSRMYIFVRPENLPPFLTQEDNNG